VNSQKRQRVVCGMSGGVDSSATAALLLEQGYDVIGITLKLWPQDCVNRAEDKCCGPQAVTDARAVCHQLGIPYYLIDEAAEFQKHAIQYFAPKSMRLPRTHKILLPDRRPVFLFNEPAADIRFHILLVWPVSSSLWASRNAASISTALV
jgi:hypothetical protein